MDQSVSLLPSISDERAALQKLLQERQHAIGSSDMQHVMGIGYGCPRMLWYQKRGAKPDYPFHGNYHTERGSAMEEIVARVYLDKFPALTLTNADVVRHPEHPYLLAHIDRLIHGDPRGTGILEIKVPSREMFMLIQRDGLPDSYQLQLQWQMFLSGYHWGQFGVFWPDEWTLEICEVKYDAAVGEALFREALVLWGRVENGPAPSRLLPTDKRCGRCSWRTTCQGQGLLQIAAREVYESDGDIQFDSALAEKVDKYREALEVCAAAEEIKELRRKDIADALGERTVVDTNGSRIYFRAQKRESLSKEPLLQYLRTLARAAIPWLRNEQADLPELPPAVRHIVEQAAELPELISENFTNRSVSRPMRIYSR